MTAGRFPTPTLGRSVGVALLVLMTLLGLAAPALAQEGEAVTTTLTYRDPETNDRVPVSNVTISVSTEDGEVLGEGVTDEDGSILVPVEGAGRYVLTLDPDTLPEGVSLTDPDRTTATVEAEVGQTVRAIFGLTFGEGGPAREGITLRQVLQLTVEGLKLGLFLGMAAIGLSLIFGTTGLVNFAHGEMVTWGMLTAYFFNFFGLAGAFGFLAGLPPPLGGGVNLIIAALFAVVIGAGTGWLVDAWIFAPLRRRGTSLISQLVITIGLSILLRYIFLYIFGGNNRFFRDYTAQTAMKIGLVEITPKDLITAIISILVLVAVGVLLQGTKLGKAMRAVADNRDLAESSGIDVQRVIRLVWTFGGALAGLGGVFIGLSEQVSWLIGFRILLLIFAGVVLGGLGTAYGALVGSLLVGIGIQVSTLFIPIELKNVGALAVLALVLVIRPQGILGRAERVG